jgi:hypothetical protein
METKIDKFPHTRLMLSHAGGICDVGRIMMIKQKRKWTPTNSIKAHFPAQCQLP